VPGATIPAVSNSPVAARCAFAGAALFVALIAAFSSLGGGAPSGPMLLAIGVIGVASHVVLLPVVAALSAPEWARAGGYAWIAIDAMLNVARVNGAASSVIDPLRLGGHISAGIWMLMAASEGAGPVCIVGVPLAVVLMAHALTSQWIPPWILFIPFMTIPVWLTLVGVRLRRVLH